MPETRDSIGDRATAVADYGGNFFITDGNSRRVRRKIGESRLGRNTLVLFVNDNGGPTMPGTTINGSRNDPLRGNEGGAVANRPATGLPIILRRLGNRRSSGAAD